MSNPSVSPPSSVEGLTLRVAEALAKDVGRGVVRIDPEAMTSLGIDVGDVVKLKGKRETVAKVMPTFSDVRGKDLAQMDGIIRGNAQAGVDEKVHLSRAATQPAQSIVLDPLSVMPALGRRGRADNGYLVRLLEGLPLVKGDRVRATLFGSRAQDFSVTETAPPGAVTVRPETQIRLKTKEPTSQTGRPERKSFRIAYEDIGGLHKETQRVREMIELPLKYPQVFERLGIEPPKGVLLIGPPGTGKTLIAKAVANETDAYFLALSGPEIIHKFYGESEAKLREVFDRASKNAPAILFLDEIDAIAPKRESVVGEVEKRVVAQLLALLDGLEERGQVVVIGATNIPNALDPALRRPGRFDREISIGVPDRKGRLEILQIHTRGMPLTDDVDLERIADITPGFVGADIAALCREAAMLALRTVLPDIPMYRDADSIPYETLLTLEVSMENFTAALCEVEPSATREVLVEVPNVRWDDVGGLGEIKQRLIEAVEWPLKHADLFAHTHTEAPKGILLYGPPGTGKTLIAKAVATESEANFISVKGPALLSKWVGESEKGVRELFRKARHVAPCIVFLDEIDALAPVRGHGGGDSGVTERVISQLLTEMDGIEELRGVVVLGGTNRLDMVDSALLRPGRFDVVLEVPLPQQDERLDILGIHTREKPIDASADLDRLAAETEGMTGADLAMLCRRAALLAIRRFLEQAPSKVKDVKTLKIGSEQFQQALLELRGAPHNGRIND